MAGDFSADDVSRDQLKRGLDNHSIILIDVREPDEFAAGHIPGARLNALQRFDPAALPPPEAGKQIVFSCRSGKRSLAALQRARAAGRTDITAHYGGGMLDWNAAGEAVEE